MHAARTLFLLLFLVLPVCQTPAAAAWLVASPATELHGGDELELVVIRGDPQDPPLPPTLVIELLAGSTRTALTAHSIDGLADAPLRRYVVDLPAPLPADAADRSGPLRIGLPSGHAILLQRAPDASPRGADD